MFKTIVAIAALALCFAPTSSAQMTLSGIGLLSDSQPVFDPLMPGDYFGISTVSGCSHSIVVYDMTYTPKGAESAITINHVNGVFTVPSSPGASMYLGATAFCQHDGGTHGVATGSVTLNM